MSDFPFDAIGLDLDGTLLDTKADLAAAVNHALAQGGYRQVPPEQVEGLIGGGAKVMLARAIESQGGRMADVLWYLAGISNGRLPCAPKV